MTLDPVVEEPPRDPVHPARMVSARLPSHGEELNGVVYVPGGAGPHPGVLVLHGLPGFERNQDLAQAYRRAGWTSMVFHYRGAWGSPGRFGFAAVLEDVCSAMEHLRSEEGRATCRVDPDRIALVGHSMGGWAALMTAAGGGTLGACSIAAFNVGGIAALAAGNRQLYDVLVEVFSPQMGPLGGIDPRELFDAALANAAAWDVRSKAAALAGVPLLLLAATDDPEVPLDLHHVPMIEAFEAAGVSRLRHRVLPTDHAFSDRRLEIARETVSWLSSLL